MKYYLPSCIIAFLFLTSCSLEPEDISESNKAQVFSEKVAVSSVATKNFLQINNTYSNKTGITATSKFEEFTEIQAAYELLKNMLPGDSNPMTLNGFNQIASTRLAFLYCNEFVNNKEGLVEQSNAEAAKSLIEGFVDVDIENNEDHKNLYTNAVAIMNDDDSLIDEDDTETKKTKLLKLTCTAILASSYVTLL